MEAAVAFVAEAAVASDVEADVASVAEAVVASVAEAFDPAEAFLAFPAAGRGAARAYLPCYRLASDFRPALEMAYLPCYRLASDFRPALEMASWKFHPACPLACPSFLEMPELASVPLTPVVGVALKLDALMS